MPSGLALGFLVLLNDFKGEARSFTGMLGVVVCPGGAVAVEGVPVVKPPPHTSQRPALEGVHTPVTQASSSWGHCQSESSFAYSHNLWTFHPKHHAAQTMADGDEAGAQGYSFCDQFPADSKTVFTSIFFSLMEGLPGKGRFLKLWLWRKKKN